MKVPVSWLRDYIKEPFEADDLAHRITMAGTEVAGIERIGSSWEGVCVGLVLEVNPHPNADRLRLVTVDTGSSRNEVVCGAPNVAAGQKIAYARIGACLIDGHTGQPATLKPAKIRGVVSEGMVCSEKELGLSDDHEGIIELPESAPLGIPLTEYMGETVLDLEVTPNRPDMLSVIGVACEGAALLGVDPVICEPEFTGKGESIDQLVDVSIEAPELCMRYAASLVRGITIKESPDWLKNRLVNAGMRPINNVVDVTNYVMLEYGQPLHAFDYRNLAGQKIIVRRADEGANFKTLDGIERKLSSDMLMICDGKGPVAIAGVMGGENSEVTPGTTDVLLESASFLPASVHFTSSRLGLTSAASQRFERGLSPHLALKALKRATSLIAELAGGMPATGCIDKAPGLKPVVPVPVKVSRVNGLLGASYNREEIVSTLELLGCELLPGSNQDEMAVKPPYWRSDINIEADVIEEVARIRGYDTIPLNMLDKAIPNQTPNPMLGFKRHLRQALVGLGFSEIQSWAMTSSVMLKKVLNQAELEIWPLHLKKPMTVEQECLRTSLRPYLVSSLASNRRFEEGAIRLFELGSVYLPREGNLPREPQILAGIISASRVKEHWDIEPEKTDFFTLKGIVEGLLASAGVQAEYLPSNDGGLKPGVQAAIMIEGKQLGVLGELHPQVCKAMELDESVYLFEIDASQLLQYKLVDKSYRPVPRYPAVLRDIALVVENSVTHSQVMEVLSGYPLVVDVKLFDIYTGKPVPEGSKSMAYRLAFMSDKKTLTDQAVDKVLEQILSRLEKQLGAVLRR
ncbi:MAG: phenylalanine--tRNA ligase subunit beta [Dehalococcoidales bacterium]|jgi:phenylalanyl-tRNA synthetase beta chain|nr:phenylalanine--tRNA ligase subunit beta [Dehalococcoidales bacterium]MDD5122489.1 phenylalanine--tRNA ligase subunit beta [Dehalococcoidales bacterium]MDD5498335.1 phenylalanine--tRNA ligase subunit beta [Dehalococcoidales bacterium]MDX9803023.1 phenylalanine--tRNA ligase subunit beta [Dehalococcoidales bacterium]